MIYTLHTRTCSITTRHQQQEEQLNSPNLHIEKKKTGFKLLIKLSTYVPTQENNHLFDQLQYGKK